VKAERWQQVKVSLDEALGLEPSARRAFLEQIGRDDPELHDELVSLINAADRAGDNFLDGSAAAGMVGREMSLPSRVGRRIGPYRLDQLIGSGGMGEVYRAVRVDGDFTMQVAIKLIPAGRDTRFVIARFKAERQILAGLEHPNIARLLDGGSTEDGMPYLVMELVEGLPIQQYCDQRQLDLAARLRLFLQVCGAVQYAHQRLVIHRDLKPNNILVGADGVPKLLDFGIAKIFALDDTRPVAQETLTVLRQLTPDYASPEQVHGQPITTVSDVYSLGVILYELLTGARPRNGREDGGEAATQGEAVRPSRAVRRRTGESAGGAAPGGHSVPFPPWRQLRGDLDNIVLMALRTDPARRYASVEQLAEDIRRYLASKPVIARADTWAYRATKFLRRHAVGATAAAAIFVAILAALVVVEHQSRIARAARLRAEQRFNDVRQLAHALIFELHDAIQDLPGGTAARRQLVRTALHYLDSLAQESSDEPSLQLELAEAYSRLGDIQGRALGASESDTPGAIQSYRHALALRAEVLKGRPDDPAVRAAMVASWVQLSELSWLAHQADAALTDAGQAVTASQWLVDRHPDDAQYRLLLARSLLASGYLRYKIKGEADEALQSLGRAVDLFKPAWADHPEDPTLGRQLSLAYTRSGEILGTQPGKLDQAIAMDLAAREVLQNLVAGAPHNADLRHLLAFADFGLAGLLINAQKIDLAAQREQTALAEIKALSAEDPNIVEYHVDVAFVTGNLGRIANLQGRFAQAIDLARSGLAEMAPIHAEANGYYGYANVVLREDLGAAHAGLGADPRRGRLQRIQDWRAARDWYGQALSLLDALSAQSKEAKSEAAAVAARRDHCARELEALGSSR
jgi:non-specific serine/threonine protein kinase/serine/threonine-protein kinase